MEINLTALLEAAHGVTTQGAVVIVAGIIGTVLLAWMRLVFQAREHKFFLQATPEQIMARASTYATLPKPVKAPPSPIGPALVLILTLAGSMWWGARMASARRHPQEQQVVLAAALAQKPRPADLCSPRCPRNQVCSGKICTMMAKPRPVQPPKLAEAPAATSSEPAPETPKPGPQSSDYAVLTTSWTDGRDPFETEPECIP